MQNFFKLKKIKYLLICFTLQALLSKVFSHTHRNEDDKNENFIQEKFNWLNIENNKHDPRENRQYHNKGDFFKKNKHEKKENGRKREHIQKYTYENQFVSYTNQCPEGSVLINGDCLNTKDFSLLIFMSQIIAVLLYLIIFMSLIILFLFLLKRCRRKFKILKFLKFRKIKKNSTKKNLKFTQRQIEDKIDYSNLENINNNDLTDKSQDICKLEIVQEKNKINNESNNSNIYSINQNLIKKSQNQNFHNKKNISSGIPTINNIIDKNKCFGFKTTPTVQEIYNNLKNQQFQNFNNSNNDFSNNFTILNKYQNNLNNFNKNNFSKNNNFTPIDNQLNFQNKKIINNSDNLNENINIQNNHKNKWNLIKDKFPSLFDKDDKMKLNHINIDNKSPDNSKIYNPFTEKFEELPRNSNYMKGMSNSLNAYSQNVKNHNYSLTNDDQINNKNLEYQKLFENYIANEKIHKFKENFQIINQNSDITNKSNLLPNKDCFYLCENPTDTNVKQDDILLEDTNNFNSYEFVEIKEQTSNNYPTFDKLEIDNDFLENIPKI